jgi:hypothetical protein
MQRLNWGRESGAVEMPNIWTRPHCFATPLPPIGISPGGIGEEVGGNGAWGGWGVITLATGWIRDVKGRVEAPSPDSPFLPLRHSGQYRGLQRLGEPAGPGSDRKGRERGDLADRL